MTRLHVGNKSPPIDASTLGGEPITLPAATGDDRLVHLQFRRFAGCPICNLHPRSGAPRIGGLTRANPRGHGGFPSAVATMLPFQGVLPFEVIADPEKKL